MNYKLPFFLLAGGIITIGLFSGAYSQVLNEPAMEIDMISGQTDNPFRIQDENDVDVFRVNVDGRTFPIQKVELVHNVSTEFTFSNEFGGSTN